MNVTYTAITLPSRLSILAGKKLIGDPAKWDLGPHINSISPLTAEEFYAVPLDRPQFNQDLVKRAGNWEMMMRNLQVDQVRSKMRLKLSIYAFVFSFTVMVTGTALNTGVSKTKGFYNQIAAKMQSDDSKEKRISELEAKAQELQKQFKAGQLTKEQFKQQVEIVDAEYQLLIKNK